MLIWNDGRIKTGELCAVIETERLAVMANDERTWLQESLHNVDAKNSHGRIINSPKKYLCIISPAQ